MKFVSAEFIHYIDSTVSLFNSLVQCGVTCTGELHSNIDDQGRSIQEYSISGDDQVEAKVSSKWHKIFDQHKQHTVYLQNCHQGLKESATDENGDFVQEFIGYSLIQHNLSNVIALEVVHPVEEHQNIECTAEIEVDKLGTVVLPQSMVPTGWPGPLQPSEGDPPAGQSWAPRVNESHKVFINKPIITAKELMDELVCQGVIMV